jgi:5-hydroxyisourate hydrolase
MAEGPPTISTHVLDVGLGTPAPGVRVRLERILADGAAVPVGEGVTDADGRVRRLLTAELALGDYRLVFHLPDDGRSFFHIVSLEFHVADLGRSYHVPLLWARHAISSYRGS